MKYKFGFAPTLHMIKCAMDAGVGQTPVLGNLYGIQTNELGYELEFDKTLILVKGDQKTSLPSPKGLIELIGYGVAEELIELVKSYHSMNNVLVQADIMIRHSEDQNGSQEKPVLH